MTEGENRRYKILVSTEPVRTCVYRPTGAVRVSFGWMSSEEDVQAIITFLKTCFLDTAGRHDPSGQNLRGHNLDGQNPHGQNPTSTPAACAKANPSGRSPTGHNPRGHNPGVQDPSFSLNAHCSTVVPSAADSNHLSPVHSTARSIPVNSQSHGHQWHSQHTQSSSQPLQGTTEHDRAHIQSAELQTSHTGSKTHAQSEAEPLTSAQAVAVQHSKRCAWLRQLAWVSCGDQVAAWPAASDESQRLTPPSPSPSEVQSGIQPRGQPRDQSGGPPLDTSAPSCRQQAQSPHSPCESANSFCELALKSASHSASQSVLHSDFQHDSDSHSMPSSLHYPTTSAQHNSESQLRCSQGSLEGIWVYPIKSCGGVRVSEWPLGPNGLLLDREWALVGDDGHVLTQKGLPKLALVQPNVDLWQGFIQVRLANIGNDAACCLVMIHCRALCRCRASTQFQNRMLLQAAQSKDGFIFSSVVSCLATAWCPVVSYALPCCAVLRYASPCCAVLCTCCTWTCCKVRHNPWQGIRKSDTCGLEAFVAFPPMLMFKPLVLCTNQSHILTPAALVQRIK